MALGASLLWSRVKPSLVVIWNVMRFFNGSLPVSAIVATLTSSETAGSVDVVMSAQIL